MAEVIGDVVIPSCIIIPKKEGNYTGKLNEIWLSGNKLYIGKGSGTFEIVTSA